ncbi:CLIP domain-containing serine protease B15 [Aedes albopictus]|uniref:CLIP domain-containing serine protease n=1 Tax=Aedes albopictus TaxID=7160 RepID=A0ABM1YCF8_AEDAL
MHQSVFRRRASQTIPLLISVKMCSFLVALLIVMHWGFPLVSSNLNDTCVTDSGRSGRCVLVRDCQYALDILHDNYLTYEEYRYIDNNMCGKVPGKPPLPLICCPSIQNVASCGVSVVPRIFGGNETNAGIYPWAGVIQYINKRGQFEVQCGCALIHRRWVLTAAHCIVGVPRGIFVHSVRFNEWNTRKRANCTTKDDIKICRAVYKIEQQFVHPSYVIYSSNMRHDIGLLKTAENVEITDYVIPICLPFRETLQELPIEGELFTVTGWGRTDKDTSGLQRHVSMTGQNRSMCDAAFKPQRIKLTADQLCVGGEEGQDSCRGDSGGPLMYEDGLVTYVLGIVSFGSSDCGTKNHPGVYTKVVNYLNWIEDTMIENS